MRACDRYFRTWHPPSIKAAITSAPLSLNALNLPTCSLNSRTLDIDSASGTGDFLAHRFDCGRCRHSHFVCARNLRRDRHWLGQTLFFNRNGRNKTQFPAQFTPGHSGVGRFLSPFALTGTRDPDWPLGGFANATGTSLLRAGGTCTTRVLLFFADGLVAASTRCFLAGRSDDPASVCAGSFALVSRAALSVFGISTIRRAGRLDVCRRIVIEIPRQETESDLFNLRLEFSSVNSALNKQPRYHRYFLCPTSLKYTLKLNYFK